MEVIAGAFAGLGLLWALFWIGLFIAWIVCAENESPGIALGLMVIGVFFLSLVTTQSIWTPIYFVANNIVAIVISAIVYLMVGTGYGFFKWDRYCAKLARDNAAKLANGGWVSDSSLRPPAVMENKYKFTTWTLLWPASMFWYFCCDLLLEIRDFILEQFGTVYAKIAYRHFAQFENEIERRRDKATKADANGASVLKSLGN